MLILTRRVGERLRIGADVTVEVCGVSGSHVRLGVSAPRSVAVDREEVHGRKEVEREIATLMHKKLGGA